MVQKATLEFQRKLFTKRFKFNDTVGSLGRNFQFENILPELEITRDKSWEKATLEFQRKLFYKTLQVQRYSSIKSWPKVQVLAEIFSLITFCLS